MIPPLFPLLVILGWTACANRHAKEILTMMNVSSGPTPPLLPHYQSRGAMVYQPRNIPGKIIGLAPSKWNGMRRVALKGAQRKAIEGINLLHAFHPSSVRVARVRRALRLNDRRARLW